MKKNWAGETGTVICFRVGEMGVGDKGVGEMGQIIGEMRVSEMGVNRISDHALNLYQVSWKYLEWSQSYGVNTISKLNKSTACGCLRSAVAAFRKF